MLGEYSGTLAVWRNVSVSLLYGQSTLNFIVKCFYSFFALSISLYYLFEFKV
jgi:hypothetical protein